MSPNLAALLDRTVQDYADLEAWQAVETVVDEAPHYADALLGVAQSLNEITDELARLEDVVSAAAFDGVDHILTDKDDRAEARDGIAKAVRDALRTSALEDIVSRLSNDAYITDEDCIRLRNAVDTLPTP